MSFWDNYIFPFCEKSFFPISSGLSAFIRFVWAFKVLNAKKEKHIVNKNNLKKIIKIVHKEVRKKMNAFLKRNKKKRIVILDIPLLLENKINNKKDILVFVESKRSDILKRLKKRNNFNEKLYKKFKSIQLPPSYKKMRSKFIIRNDFKNKSVKKSIKDMLNQIK